MFAHTKKVSRLENHFRISEKAKMCCEKRDHRWLTVAIHFHFRLPLFSFGVAAREMFHEETSWGRWMFVADFSPSNTTTGPRLDSIHLQLFSLALDRLWKCQKYFFTFFIRALADFVCSVCFSRRNLCKESQLVLSSRETEAHPAYVWVVAVEGRVQCIFNLFLAVSRINFIFNNLLPFHANVCASSTALI